MSQKCVQNISDACKCMLWVVVGCCGQFWAALPYLGLVMYQAVQDMHVVMILLVACLEFQRTTGKSCMNDCSLAVFLHRFYEQVVLLISLIWTFNRFRCNSCLNMKILVDPVFPYLLL